MDARGVVAAVASGVYRGGAAGKAQDCHAGRMGTWIHERGMIKDG